MFEDLKRLFRHGSVYLLGNILNRVGAFLLLPLYTTYLTVHEYGILEILYSTTAIISVVFAAGMSHTTLRFYYEYEKQSDRNAVITTNFALVIIFSTLGALALHTARFGLSEFLFDTTDYADAIDLVLLIMVLELSTEIGFAYLRAREQSLFYVLLSLSRLVIQISLSIYFVSRLHMGVQGVLSANLASVALGWMAVTGYSLYRCGITLHLGKIPAMLRYSIPVALTAMIGTAAFNADRFLLKEMMSLEAVGLYGLSLKFALLLMFLVAEPFFRAYGPFRFSIIHQENARDIQALVVHYLLVGAIFVSLGISLLMPEVLRLVSSPAYVSAYLYTPFLLLGVIVSAIAYCFETGILYKKKPKYISYISIVGLFVKVGLNIALIPVFGLYGAAIAFLLSNILHATLINVVSQHLYPVTYHYLGMLKIVLIGVVVYLLSLSIGSRYSMYVSIPAKLALVGIYVLLVYLLDQKTRDVFSKAGSYLKQFKRMAGNENDSKL